MAVALGAVAVELRVSEVKRKSLRRRDGSERGIDVAGDAEIVAVDVQRMRHAELEDGPGKRMDDLPGRHAMLRPGLVDG